MPNGKSTVKQTKASYQSIEMPITEQLRLLEIVEIPARNKEFLLVFAGIPQEKYWGFLHPLKIPARNTEFLQLMQEHKFRRKGQKLKKKTEFLEFPAGTGGTRNIVNLCRNSFLQEFATESLCALF